VEKDVEKQKAMKLELVAKAKAEQAARKAAEEKAAKGPMYPTGLMVRFGKREATITAAHQDAQGAWHYSISLKAGEFLGLGDGVYQMSETDVRSKVQEEVGPLQPGQAFAPNVTIYRNGQGGRIESATKNAAGVWQYVISGWGAPVSQSELLGILTR